MTSGWSRHDSVAALDVGPATVRVGDAIPIGGTYRAVVAVEGRATARKILVFDTGEQLVMTRATQLQALRPVQSPNQRR